MCVDIAKIRELGLHKESNPIWKHKGDESFIAISAQDLWVNNCLIDYRIGSLDRFAKEYNFSAERARCKDGASKRLF